MADGPKKPDDEKPGRRPPDYYVAPVEPSDPFSLAAMRKYVRPAKPPLDSDTALNNPELTQYGYRGSSEVSENSAVPDPAHPAPVAGHDPLPKNWIEAVPAIIFGFYGLAYAFEAVGAMNRGDIGFFIANTAACILCAAVALAWWKRRDWLPQKLVESSTLIVTDARWIIGIMSVFLIVSALAPYVEQHRWPFAWQFTEQTPTATKSDANSDGTYGSGYADYPNDSHAPIVWQPQFQLMSIGTTTGPQIAGLYFQGISNSRIQMTEAYLTSELTGHKEALKANIQYKGEYPVDQVDIPPGASVDLILDLKPPLSVSDFLERWGSLQFIAIYNGTTHEKTYDENYVRGLVQNTIPGAVGPRMTPKGQ